MKLTKLFSHRVLNLIISTLLIGNFAVAAVGDVDTSFNPQLTIDLTGEHGGNAVFQSDGKIIVFGSYSTAVKPFFRRLNTDGTLDSTFSCPECLSFVPRSVTVQPDGKLLVIGGFPGQYYGRLIRVNQNGSLDTSFNALFNNTNPCQIYDLVLQTDGKSIVRCTNQLSTGGLQELVRRLNSNGSLDTTFQTITAQTNPNQFVGKMVLLPDGKLLIGYYGGSGGNRIKRYNSDGNSDNTFQATPNGTVTGIGLLPDGKYLIGGDFSNVNGTSRSKIAKLFPDGSLDTSFSPNFASNETFSELKVLPSGQFYIRLYITPFLQDPIARFIRYNSDGSTDNAFNQTFLHPDTLAVDNLNRIITFRSKDPRRYYRINTDGNIDTTFNPIISVDGFNITAALQNDGKIVIGGEFGKANGINSVRITRVNSDGATDSTFNAGSGFDSAPIRLAVQPDGKILASGFFTVFNGSPRATLVRLNANGSLDLAFNPVLTGTDSIWNVYAITPQADGKVLIGGNFRTVNGTSLAGFARLNADGSLDTTFINVFSGFNTVNSILIQPDGKIMVGTNGNLVRLNSAGSLDGSFVGSSISDVGQVIQLPDGKYIVFTKNSGGNTTSTIRRLFSNGTTDFSFGFLTQVSATTINTIFRQPTGDIVFGGTFGDVNGRSSRNIGRVGPSGESDIYFPIFGAVGSVDTILGQTDGKIIFVGNFTGIEDVGRSGIARLSLSNRTKGTTFDFDGDGRSDISVFRPSTNIWYEFFSNNSTVGVQSFGENGDIAAPADYDGDGKTDLGVFRPSIGDWLYLSSGNNTFTQYHFGQAGDIPRPSDASGDGKAELVVYRPSNNAWYRTAGVSFIFGSAGDKPLIGDFDGDGRSDLAIYRPATGDWWYAASSANHQQRAVHWGISTDVPAAADFDGDGKTDFAVYRPTTGTWYISGSSTGSATVVNFGIAEDKPVAADYDGDGKADIAVYRPSTGIWYLLRSNAGFAALQFGISSDVPVPHSFVP